MSETRVGLFYVDVCDVLEAAALQLFAGQRGYKRDKRRI